MVLWGLKVVGAPGFEPGTFCTPSKRATRLRYAPTKRVLTTKKVVGATGFEPATSWSRTKRSTRLSHAPSYKMSINCERFILSIAAAGGQFGNAPFQFAWGGEQVGTIVGWALGASEIDQRRECSIQGRSTTGWRWVKDHREGASRIK